MCITHGVSTVSEPSKSVTNTFARSLTHKRTQIYIIHKKITLQPGLCGDKNLTEQACIRLVVRLSAVGYAAVLHTAYVQPKLHQRECKSNAIRLPQISKIDIRRDEMRVFYQSSTRYRFLLSTATEVRRIPLSPVSTSVLNTAPSFLPTTS